MQLRTVFLLGSLTGLLLLIGYLLGGQIGVGIAFILSLAMNFYSYFNSHKLVLKAHHAEPLDQKRYPDVYEIVQSLAREYRIPTPKIWYLPTNIANAFATGRNPEHGHIAVTKGILDTLDERELRGVLAHELGHIKNRDILVSTIAVTLASAIGMLASSMRWSVYAHGEQGRGPGAILIALIVPIASTLLHMGISRTREYLADESGAHVSHDPLALASALQKIEASVQRAQLVPQTPLQATTASLFFVYPFVTGSLASLFSTHPPTKDRVARLKEMAEQIRVQ